MFGRLYDLIVFVTNNYSAMPEDFKQKFSEGECVRLRLSVSSMFNAVQIFESDEKLVCSEVFDSSG